MGDKEAYIKGFVDDLDTPEEYEEDYIDEEYEEDDYIEDEEYDGTRFHKHRKCCKCRKPIIKINSDLEVNIGNENKIIYVTQDKLQYFTASAICSSNETIEIEYCGRNTKCICGETFIFGRLGYYKIVKSGIIFIPKHKFPKILKHCNAADILHFKAKNKCGDEIEFVVVFTLFKATDCKVHYDK